MRRTHSCLRSFIFGVAIVTGCSRPVAAPELVRRAALNAGVVGQPPVEVERMLRGLTFKDGWHLIVGPFIPSRSLIEAQLRDANDQARRDWNINLTVQFDAAGKADSVAVFSSAVSPM